MRPVALSELAQWTGGRLVGADASVTSVAIDSRLVSEGALFVALSGERADGHDFLAQAAANGATAALVERPLLNAPLPQLSVASTLDAIGHIATMLRSERTSTVLALTGSNGKTSVKALLKAILERVAPTYANAGNRNNEIGMPLALIDEPVDARFAIYEMGAGQSGDIAYLAAIAKPQVALVNNIGPAHLERMGSLLGIAQTKGAIYDALPADGTAVINADDAFGAWFAQRAGERTIIRFGLEADADLRAADLRCRSESSQFRLVAPSGEVAVELPLAGRHNVSNALAAAGMAMAVGASLSVIAEALSEARPVSGRQTRYQFANGGELIDDSYNANPGSVSAAIATLAQLNSEALLVLGDMLELGPQEAELHADIGRRARDAKLAGLLTVGRLAEHASRAFGVGAEHFADQSSLIAALGMRLKPGVVCLVKGSRGSAMDRVVAALRSAHSEEAKHAA